MEPLPRLWIKSVYKIISQVTFKLDSVKTTEESSGVQKALRKVGDAAYTHEMLCSLPSEPLIQVRTRKVSRTASSATRLSSGPSAFADSVSSHPMTGERDQHACMSMRPHPPNTYTQMHYSCVGQKTKSCSILGEEDAQGCSMEEVEQRYRGTV